MADDQTLIACSIEIFERDESWWMILTGELFGPFDTEDQAIDAIPACLRATF